MPKKTGVSNSKDTNGKGKKVVKDYHKGALSKTESKNPVAYSRTKYGATKKKVK
jgi:hypothetical protein